MSFTLDAKQTALINTLIALGDGWHTRQEIASHLNKKKLDPAMIMVLEMMTSAGRVEKKQIPTSLPHILQWVYRLESEPK